VFFLKFVIRTPGVNKIIKEIKYLTDQPTKVNFFFYNKKWNILETQTNSLAQGVPENAQNFQLT
jgi:hypothetical protein